MSAQILPGSFVTHSKLPDLGSGEVMWFREDKIGIRFATGERSFSIERATPFLVVTTEAPAAPAKGKRGRAKKA